MTEMKVKLELSERKIKLGTIINSLSYKYCRTKRRIWKVLLKSNILWIIEKAREFHENICFIDYTKAFD